MITATVLLGLLAVAFLFAGRVNHLLQERNQQDLSRLRFWTEATREVVAASKHAREIRLRSQLVLEVRRRAGEWASVPLEKSGDAVRETERMHEELFSKIPLSIDERLSMACRLRQAEVVRKRAVEFAQGEGLSMDDPENRTAIQEAAVGEIEKSIAALLGPAHYAVYRRFEDSLGWRLRLIPIADRLARVDEPLQEEQTEALLKVLVSVELPAADEGLDLALVPDNVLEEAATVLSPRQVQVLKLIQAEQRWTRNMSVAGQ